MSGASWLEEFYPVSASLAEPGSDDVDLLLHSIRKWEGLHQASLDRHGVHRHPDAPFSLRDDQDVPVLGVTSSTCALCLRYLKEDAVEDEEAEGRCRDCPLCERLGAPCDVVFFDPYPRNLDLRYYERQKLTGAGERWLPPYSVFAVGGSPGLMLHALRDCLNKLLFDPTREVRDENA